MVSRAHLGHLSLTEPAQRVRQQLGDLHPKAGGDGGAPGQQIIAGDDGDEVPETAVDTLDVPPDGGLVDDVVVVERGEVDEFDRDPAHQFVLGGVAAAARRGGQCQQGAQAFAAGCDEVGRHLVQEGVTGQDRCGEQGFQSPHSLLETGQAEGLGRVHWSKR